MEKENMRNISMYNLKMFWLKHKEIQEKGKYIDFSIN